MDIDWSAISTGTQIFGQAISIAKALKEATSGTKESAVVDELLEKLLEARISNLELVDLARQAKDKVMELERSINEREKYTLFELAPGKFALKFQPRDGMLEPAHYLCQVCFDAGHKSVLQTKVDFMATLAACFIDSQHNIVVGPGKPVPRVNTMR